MSIAAAHGIVDLWTDAVTDTTMIDALTVIDTLRVLVAEYWLCNWGIVYKRRNTICRRGMAKLAEITVPLRLGRAMTREKMPKRTNSFMMTLPLVSDLLNDN